MKLIDLKIDEDQFFAIGAGPWKQDTKNVKQGDCATIRDYPIGAQLVGIRGTHILLDRTDLENLARNPNYLISLIRSMRM